MNKREHLQEAENHLREADQLLKDRNIRHNVEREVPVIERHHWQAQLHLRLADMLPDS